MAKKKTDDNGWVFHDSEHGVTGTKVFGDGDVRDVMGTDEENARANAAETDRVHDLRVRGTREQNKAIADRLHAHADSIATSV